MSNEFIKIPENVQHLLQQMMQQMGKEIPKLVQEEIMKQSPIIGIEGRTYGGKWKEKENKV